MSQIQRGTTRKLYPLAVAAIRFGKYHTECITLASAKGIPHPVTAIFRGNLVVHDVKSPGEALKWIQEREEEVLAKRTATVRP